VLRGEVFWYDPDPIRSSEQAGRRPAVLVSRDAINRASPVGVVVPLTTDRRRGRELYPSEVRIYAPEGGVTRDSLALALHVRAIDKSRLSGPVGRLTPPDITPQGVEVFAVCSKTAATGDTPAKRKVRDEMFNERYQALSKKFLKQLRSQALIEYK